jgi:hypothetical protein
MIVFEVSCAMPRHGHTGQRVSVERLFPFW